MQRYEKYKDSGVDWIGEIPEHWEVSRLKNHIYFITGFPFKSEKYSYEGIKLARGINVKEGVFNWDDTRFWPTIENHLENYLLKENDVLIAMDGSKVGKNFCKVSVDDLPILLLQRVARLRTKFTLNANFLYINIVNRSFLYWVELTKTDPMVPHISPDDIKNFIIAIPPISEQQTIANFLDDKTAKIDQTIAIKQKEIELLKERRQILIQKAVTKGLDDTVTFKDSGVDWIGEIPEHWEVRKLKSFCKAFGRIGFRGYTTADLVDEGEGAITISPSNIKENEMLFEKNSFLSWNKYNESPEIKIRENDILIVKTGSTYGKVGIVKNLPQKATINPQLLVLKNIKINPDYFYELLKSGMFQLQVEKNVIGSTIPTISETKILGFSVPMPRDDKEFNTIANYIYNINEKLFALIKLKQQEIEKLKEYKTVLIDNVVTGKVKIH